MKKKKIRGTLSLSVFMETQEKLEEFVAKFSDFNIDRVTAQLALPDESIHSVKVEDFFINWDHEDAEE
ncbi:hypothetical protein [Cytobacillus praedii]|uniref:Uncharacterized protein n=1 Tax=Cytobacillus praedii TaxID=1742358 RepID=A0A4R1AU47_9BACI|nr:hypothetical protein [Cytobacillus praedii]TCJ00436.1 hypothetical protein E0Y62_26860 [Cytobacillus praedii]